MAAAEAVSPEMAGIASDSADAVPSSGSSSLKKTVWGLLDQGTVSAGNFLTNLLLLRVLTPTNFGTYALLLNAIIFLNTVQQSLVGYPLCVRGAQAEGRRFRSLVRVALLAAFGLGLLNALVMLGVCGYLGRLGLFVPAAFALIFWQLQDTARSGFISQLRQKAAIPGDALSYLGQAVLVGVLARLHLVTIVGALWLIGATSLVAFGVQLWQLRPVQADPGELRPMFRDFWMLGRWSVPARFTGFFTLQAFPWVIAFRHGTAEVATYQALFQLIALSNPILVSMGNLIIASIARSAGRQVWAGVKFIALALGLVGGYLLLLSIAGPGFLGILYGRHSSYVGQMPLLRMFALAWMFEAVALVATATLGGLEKVKGQFWIQLSGCICALAVALPLVYRRGLPAAALGLLMVNAVRAIVGVALVLRAQRSVRDGDAPDQPILAEVAGAHLAQDDQATVI